MIDYLKDLIMIALGWTIINIVFVLMLEGLCH